MERARREGLISGILPRPWSAANYSQAICRRYNISIRSGKLQVSRDNQNNENWYEEEYRLQLAEKQNLLERR